MYMNMTLDGACVSQWSGMDLSRACHIIVHRKIERLGTLFDD